VSGYSNWLLHRSALLDTLSVRYRIAALVLALSFLGIVLSPASSHAGTGRAALVLSVSDGGRQNDMLRLQMEEIAQSAGATLVATPDLSAEDRVCDEPKCIEALNVRYRFDAILSAKISKYNKHDRIVEMWLYETGSGRDLTERNICDERELKVCVRSLAGKIFGAFLSGPLQAKVVPTTASVEPVAHGPYVPTRWKMQRGLALGLGALAVGSLIVGIATTTAHGKAETMDICRQTLSQDRCGYDMRSAFVPSYIAAGAFAVGSILSFTWPAPIRSKREK